MKQTKKKRKKNTSEMHDAFLFLFSDMKVVGCLAIRRQMEEGLDEH